MVVQDRSHEFYIAQDAQGRWRWTWLLPMRDAAVQVHGLHPYKTRAGALRSAYVQTDKLRQMMVELSRGDMV